MNFGKISDTMTTIIELEHKINNQKLYHHRRPPDNRQVQVADPVENPQFSGLVMGGTDHGNKKSDRHPQKPGKQRYF